jgi:hypothetical protein
MVVEGLLLTPRLDGSVPVKAASWEWWLLTYSPAQHGFIMDVMASVLMSISSGGEVVLSLYEEDKCSRGLPTP